MAKDRVDAGPYSAIFSVYKEQPTVDILLAGREAGMIRGGITVLIFGQIVAQQLISEQMAAAYIAGLLSGITQSHLIVERVHSKEMPPTVTPEGNKLGTAGDPQEGQGRAVIQEGD